MANLLAQLEATVTWLIEQCCPQQVAGAVFQQHVKAEQELAPLLINGSTQDQAVLEPPDVMFLHPQSKPAGLAKRIEPVTNLLVMRHAHRADEDDELWSSTAERPWDPPLSQHGEQQAQTAGNQVASQQGEQGIDYVISSPYLRCLQTSAAVVAALGIGKGQWLVDWSLGEISDPRLLVGGRPDVEQRVAGRPIEQWMWGGLPAQQALEDWAKEDSVACKLGFTPQLIQRPPPLYPETREQGLARYEREIVWMAEGGGGKLSGTCLLVTHGEAVRCAVNLMEPEATVYEVKHCAQAVLQYDPILGGFDNKQNSLPHAHPLHERLRQWRLACKSGETGVSWFV